MARSKNRPKGQDSSAKTPDRGAAPKASSEPRGVQATPEKKASSAPAEAKKKPDPAEKEPVVPQSSKPREKAKPVDAEQPVVEKKELKPAKEAQAERSDARKAQKAKEEEAREEEEELDDEEFEDEELEDEDEEEESASAAKKRAPGAKVAAHPRGDIEAAQADTILVKVRRQDDPDSDPYWEEFEVPNEEGMNVILCLMAIQRNPVNINGEKTTPVAWDQACLEEVCGSCTMVVNGRVRQSCSALIRDLELPLVLEPMEKFPVVRDLCVDRSRMFGALKRVKAWVPLDGTHDLGPGPKIAAKQQEENYVFSTCMTCGCCLDACPQVNDHSDFIGAAAIGQAYLFNNNPTGKMIAEERLEALMDDGGVHACGNAQNCVQVCPKSIPLTTAIADMCRQISVHMVKTFFKK
jgi:succinate dehydrogenase / fumarate reductase iron-sulfur subunit